ncbi:hypothetical protein F2P56_006802 [Juglans regia]|uniref:F-box associated beta-propeller type 1 domain-containing protein n=2 Tax=Juglans regia TaxID=51240 RepID=A0A834D3Z2_JUGRE|nr:uncharacterized protein LOC108982403 [Juglans regia]KAF5474950.1 hypothetical protein F2P56_006802 [Juglans regia]
MHSNDTLEFFDDAHLVSQLFSEDINLVLFFDSFNGIDCGVGIAQDRAWEIVLWNPTTRESKRLLFVPRLPDICPTFFDFDFGIDLNTNDFKMVKIMYFDSLRHYQVEVYKLTTDSWRVIDALPLINSPFLFAYIKHVYKR